MTPLVHDLRRALDHVNCSSCSTDEYEAIREAIRILTEGPYTINSTVQATRWVDERGLDHATYSCDMRSPDGRLVFRILGNTESQALFRTGMVLRWSGRTQQDLADMMGLPPKATHSIDGRRI